MFGRRLQIVNRNSPKTSPDFSLKIRVNLGNLWLGHKIQKALLALRSRFGEEGWVKKLRKTKGPVGYTGPLSSNS